MNATVFGSFMLPPGVVTIPSFLCTVGVTRDEAGEQLVGVRPAHGIHEHVHVAAGLGTEIHMVGMLVHIEREDGLPIGERVAMIGSPLIHELAVASRPREEDPARAAAERLTHCGEFLPPSLERAEIADQ